MPMLGQKNGGPCEVQRVRCFFTGRLVPPNTRLVAERVRKHKGEWKEDDAFVSVHVDPDLAAMNEGFYKQDMALVLEAQDGKHYRLSAPPAHA